MDFQQILMAAATQGGGGASSPYGPECWPQPDFDASTGLTLNGWTVSGGAAHSNSSATTMSATSLETLATGDYRLIVEGTNPDLGICRLRAAGQLLSNLGTATIAIDQTATLASISNQILSFQDVDGVEITITRFSLRRIL